MAGSSRIPSEAKVSQIYCCRSKLRILLSQIELGQAKLMEFEFVDLTPLHMLLSEGWRTADAARLMRIESTFAGTMLIIIDCPDTYLYY